METQQLFLQLNTLTHTHTQPETSICKKLIQTVSIISIYQAAHNSIFAETKCRWTAL